MWDGHKETLGDWYVCDRADGKGYRYVSHHMVRVKAHRLAYLLYHPDSTLWGLEINHLDGDRLNNRVENLERCDASRQSSHAFDIGLNPSVGVAHPLAKLNPELVREMRRERAEGVTYKHLSIRYGVAERAVWLACNRRTWRQVN